MIISTSKDLSFYKRPFRFEAMWLLHDDCEKVIQKAWENNIVGSPAFVLMRKIKITKEALKLWNKCEFGRLKRRRILLEQTLEYLQGKINSPETAKREQQVR
ncbi:hypothetical protein PTKIN_Ptkin01aG0124800 [Pterospermum kingtungense]